MSVGVVMLGGRGLCEDGEVGGGGAERRRMACVIVGWKRPPKGEWARRCVGRTWPMAKKVEKVLRVL